MTLPIPNPSFERGQQVRIEYNGQAVNAQVELASGNGRSLMLVFSGVLRDNQGGFFVGRVPLLFDDDGHYRDLVNNEAFTLSPL
jgi:hypothetical protein